MQVRPRTVVTTVPGPATPRSVAPRVGMGAIWGNSSRSARPTFRTHREVTHVDHTQSPDVRPRRRRWRWSGAACHADWSQWGGGTERRATTGSRSRSRPTTCRSSTTSGASTSAATSTRAPIEAAQHAGARRHPRRAVRRHRAGRVLRGDHRRAGRVAPQPRDARGELPRHARQHVRRAGVRRLRPRDQPRLRDGRRRLRVRDGRGHRRGRCPAGRCRSTPTPRTTRCTARPTSSTASSTSRPGATATSSRTTAT